MKRTYRCMNNEAAYGYEAWLRHTERSECASLHTSESECFMATKLPLHICEANASLTKLWIYDILYSRQVILWQMINYLNYLWDLLLKL